MSWTRLSFRSLSLILACLFFVAPLADAKYEKTTSMVGGSKKRNKWKHLGKFGYSEGMGTYAVRIQMGSQRYKLSQDQTLTLEMYAEEDWLNASSAKDVCKKKESARRMHNVTLNKDGSWGEWVNGTIFERDDPRLWHFALSDCSYALGNPQRLRVEFRALQGDRSEFSVEQQGLVAVEVVALLLSTAFGVSFGRNMIGSGKSAGYVHPVIWTMFSALIIQYISQLFHTLHMVFYSSNGAGLRPLEVMGEIFFMLSQVIQIALIILIGLGYTILQSNIGDLILTTPMYFMIAVIHMMVVGIGKLKDPSTFGYHENEGVVGWLVCVLRLMMYVWFIWAVESTKNEGGMKLVPFLRQFRTVGSIYFLTFPTLFFGCKWIDTSSQYAVIFVGMLSMQMLLNAYLAYLFFGKGEYFKVSSLNTSDLPGGVRVGIMKEE